MKSVMMKCRLSLAVIALCAASVIGSTAALAGDTTTVTVSATVVGTCKVNSGGGTVSFTLDPASTGNATGTITQPAFWCTKGASYNITDDNGANKNGVVQRMKHASLAEYIPYSFTYTTSGTGLGKSSPINMNIASTVVNADFINATGGAYADTVILTITP